MKAYSVYDARSLGRYCELVYADTPAKAKAYALEHGETFNGATWDAPSYTDLRAQRAPEIDADFDGRRILDFENPRDRRIYVKAGITCLEPEADYCAVCAARDVCPDRLEIDNGA